MSNKSYIGDIGTDIIVDTGTDISTATIAKLLVKKPDGNLATWTGTVYLSNYIKYTTILGDFDMAGTYHLQAYIEMPNWKGKGETTTFTIYKNYG